MDMIPPDLGKLPLPEPGLPSWPRYLAWLEVCRPILEAEFLAQMKPTERDAWNFLQPMGQAGFPDWTTVVRYEWYKDRLFLANQKVRE